MSEAQNIVNADPKVRDTGANVAATFDKITKAKEAIESCEAELKRANARADAAKNTDDPSELVESVEAADLAVRRSHIALRVAEAQHRHAIQAYKSAVHASLDDYHAEARAERLAACKDMDEATMALAKAQQRFAVATAKIQDSHSAGRQRTFDGSLLGLPPGAVFNLPAAPVFAASEAALWA
jgi:hypothetical protein